MVLRRLPYILWLLAPLSVQAQSSKVPAEPARGFFPPVSDMTDAEQHVKSILETDGIHVIHFWAPWCDNSTSELANGWYEVAENEANAGVSFIFVTIWNDGESGRELMTKYALPERVKEILQPDPGPSDVLENRRRTFLGLPVTWIPTTWIFHNNGQLAYAFNYGELQMETLQRAIDNTRNPWTHE